LFCRVFFCQPFCVKWCMSGHSATLSRSGRVRTNLHDLLCYHVTEHHSLRGWIFNTKSNTGSFHAPSYILDWAPLRKLECYQLVTSLKEIFWLLVAENIIAFKLELHCKAKGTLQNSCS
jgi:uncharacterized membrane protein